MFMGVSVVICCHNSAKELPKTLSYLKSQQVRENIPWEIVVVDNGSTDNTAQVALDCWSSEAPAPLKVVSEEKLGLIHARYRGLAEATYDIISFVDDDNWVCPEWVQIVSEVMSQHPELAACGGHNIPEFEIEPPSWWSQVHTGGYAIGEQGPKAGGDITSFKARLYGAGLTLRKAALQQLLDDGFQSLLVGSKGKALLRGEETELCFALALAGWHFWYEPRLQLRHFLTSDRLNWRYLRRLCRGGGASTVGLDPYRFAMKTSDLQTISFWWNVGSIEENKPRQTTWQAQVKITLKDLLRQPIKVLFSLLFPLEGDAEVLKIDRTIGRLLALLRTGEVYNHNLKTIAEAAWRKKKPSKVNMKE
jgi:cellulose synthase/poly-beta-1,6-N-acetylglucosamine synthase-like glycosyltransferase